MRQQLAGKGITNDWLQQIIGDDPAQATSVEANRLTPLKGGMRLAYTHFLAVFGEINNRDLVIKRIKAFFLSRHSTRDRAASIAELTGDYQRYVADAWPQFAVPIKRFLANELYGHAYLAHVQGLRANVFVGINSLLLTRIRAHGSAPRPRCR